MTFGAEAGQDKSEKVLSYAQIRSWAYGKSQHEVKEKLGSPDFQDQGQTFRYYRYDKRVRYDHRRGTTYGPDDEKELFGVDGELVDLIITFDKDGEHDTDRDKWRVLPKSYKHLKQTRVMPVKPRGLQAKQVLAPGKVLLYSDIRAWAYGKSQREVKEKLGSPDFQDQGQTFRYYRYDKRVRYNHRRGTTYGPDEEKELFGVDGELVDLIITFDKDGEHDTDRDKWRVLPKTYKHLKQTRVMPVKPRSLQAKQVLAPGKVLLYSDIRAWAYGKSQREVKEKLGSPDFQDQGQTFRYYRYDKRVRYNHRRGTTYGPDDEKELFGVDGEMVDLIITFDKDGEHDTDRDKWRVLPKTYKHLKQTRVMPVKPRGLQAKQVLAPGKVLLYSDIRAWAYGKSQREVKEKLGSPDFQDQGQTFRYYRYDKRVRYDHRRGTTYGPDDEKELFGVDGEMVDLIITFDKDGEHDTDRDKWRVLPKTYKHLKQTRVMPVKPRGLQAKQVLAPGKVLLYSDIRAWAYGKSQREVKEKLGSPDFQDQGQTFRYYRYDKRVRYDHRRGTTYGPDDEKELFGVDGEMVDLIITFDKDGEHDTDRDKWRVLPKSYKHLKQTRVMPVKPADLKAKQGAP